MSASVFASALRASRDLFRLAAPIVVLLAFACASRALAADYYLSSSGSDASSGSQTSPWRSLGKVNATHLNPGDRVILASGDMFDGFLTLDVSEAGTSAAPIVIMSSGRPRAEIVAANASAISAVHGGIEIRNLLLKGAATKASKQSGIAFHTKPPGNAHNSHIVIDNVEVTGFGGAGISLASDGGAGTGYRDVRITNAYVHDNYGTGIETSADVSWDHPNYAHDNFTISDCTVARNHSGSGMIVSGVGHALIEYCRAYGNDGNGGGVGIWAYAARDVTFRYCISSGTTSNNGGDGGGFDLDGACVDCKVESCLSYGNDGPGYMHCDYPTASPTRGNAIRTSISVNDGRKQKGAVYGFGFCTWGSGLDDCVIEDNAAIVTLADPHARQNGVYWVSYIPESSDDAKYEHRPQHLLDCVFRRNVALVTVPGVAYVSDDMPAATTANVVFQDNSFQAENGASPVFVQGAAQFDSIDLWRDATGQEAIVLDARSDSHAHPRSDLANSLAQITDPRSLPSLGLMKALRDQAKLND